MLVGLRAPAYEGREAVASAGEGHLVGVSHGLLDEGLWRPALVFGKSSEDCITSDRAAGCYFERIERRHCHLCGRFPCFEQCPGPRCDSFQRVLLVPYGVSPAVA